MSRIGNDDKLFRLSREIVGVLAEVSQVRVLPRDEQPALGKRSASVRLRRSLGATRNKSSQNGVVDYE